MMNFAVIRGLVLRYLYLYRRSVPRLVELVFWPLMDLLVWGYITVYLTTLKGELGGAVTFLIGAMIFWDVIYRSSQGIAVSFLEDIWSRNVLNVFVAPLRLREFVAATYLVGLIKTTFIVAMLAVMSFMLYGFDLGNVGLLLIPFFANLLLMGWTVGMFILALLFRYGQSVEALAWGIPFLLQPFVAVFYPLEVLPLWMQAIGWCLPATHVFEGMRAVLAEGGDFPVTTLYWAFGLNAAWMLAVCAFLGFMFQQARVKGYLAKIGTQ